MEYAEFRKRYEERYPASVPVMEQLVREYPRWLKWIVLIMFLSAALLSGVHTVPTVRKGIEMDDLISAQVRDAVSLSAFVAIELGIFVSAYLMATGGGRDKWLAWFMLALAATVAIVANLYSVSRALASGGELGVTIVGVILGICLPTIALASGKMYVNMHRSEMVSVQRVRRAYREACQMFDEQVSDAYEQYQRRLDRREQRGQVSASVRSDGQSDSNGQSSGYGYMRTADARTRVLDYLAVNPQDAGLSVRELAGRLGVGKSTVADALRDMRVPSTNGHHEGE